MLSSNTVRGSFSRKLLVACAFAVPFAAAEMASAQVSPSSVPNSVQPGQIGQRFQPSTTGAGETSAIAAPDRASAVPVAASLTKELNKSFVLKSVEIVDDTVYPKGTFDPLFAGKVGKTTTLADLRVIAREITSRYRQDGYILSQAVIPSQKLGTGVLRIRVVEGFINKVSVNLDNPNADRRGLIAGFGRKISQTRPLSTEKLERYMLLINDIPGVKAKALLKPSTDTFGAADLVIDVTTKSIGASFTSDNRGNKYIGPWQEQATLTENSLLGLGERTTIRGVNTIPTKELHFWDIQHEEQIGYEGTKAIVRAGFTRTRPGDVIKPLNLSGNSDNYSLTVSHPVIRSRAQNLSAHVTFDALNSENDFSGIYLTGDRTRVVRGGASYDTTDRFNGTNILSAEASQGLSWFNATDRGAGRANTFGNPNFLKMTVDASRVQNLPRGFSLLTSATGQVSSNSLPISEQLSLGGVGFGQAYDGGEVSGDQGVAGKVELRYGQPANYRYLNSYQLYSYYDIGDVFARSPAATSAKQSSLASCGAGVRANLTEKLYGYVEVGVPLTRQIGSEGNHDPRVFFSVTGRY